MPNTVSSASGNGTVGANSVAEGDCAIGGMLVAVACSSVVRAISPPPAPGKGAVVMFPRHQLAGLSG